MKVIATCFSRQEAEIIRSKLASAGIHAHISADDLAGLRPHMATEVKVLVADEDLAAAEESLLSEDPK